MPIKVRTCVRCQIDFRDEKKMKVDICEPCRVEKNHLDFLPDKEKLRVVDGKCSDTNCAVCVRKLHRQKSAKSLKELALEN